MNEKSRTFWGSWRERFHALRNIPALLAIVWNSGRLVVAGGLFFRLVGALIPISMLTVSKRILDAVQVHFSGQPLPPWFWYLVGAEFGLAVLGSLAGRTAGYFDALLADRFARYVSIRVM